MGDCQAAFSSSVKFAICRKYGNRCVVCLTMLPAGEGHCAHLLDRATLADARSFTLVPSNFEMNSEANGHLLCASCHLDYFTPDYIALCPSEPILQYLHDYLRNRGPNDTLPLYELFRLLRLASTGSPVTALPDPSGVLPFLNLYTLVILNPGRVDGLALPTLHAPPLTFFDNGKWQPLTADAIRGAPVPIIATRIFDPIDIATRNPRLRDPGYIPLSPEQAGSLHQLYWRLPIDTELILALLLQRSTTLARHCDKIRLVDVIHGLLLIERGLRSGSQGPSHDGGGPGLAGSRSNTVERGEPLRKKPCMADCWSLDHQDFIMKNVLGEMVEEASNQSYSSQERPHYGVHPNEWDVALTFSTLVDDKCEQQASFSGSMPSTRESVSEKDEDDPSKWEFGPSFTSDMIIAAARCILCI